MTDETNTKTPAEKTTEEGESNKEQTFSQTDVDKIVRDRLAQQAKNKFGDYEELKSKADGAKTTEEKLAALEQRTADAEARALRSDIAAKHGISAEDRDLFLTGADEETLTAQAKRLADREADRKKNGNVAPKEGETKSTGNTNTDLRDFAKQVFGKTD